MAILKIVNGKGQYKDQNSTKDVLDYILDPRKSKLGLYGYFQVDPQDPAKSMRDVATFFGKEKGVQIRHYVITFPHYEATEPILVAQFADYVAEYLSADYQTVYAVHEDSTYVHIHFVCNAINYRTGKRYPGDKKELYSFESFLRKLLRKFGVYYFRIIYH